MSSRDESCEQSLVPDCNTLSDRKGNEIIVKLLDLHYYIPHNMKLVEL